MVYSPLEHSYNLSIHLFLTIGVIDLHMLKALLALTSVYRVTDECIYEDAMLVI